MRSQCDCRHCRSKRKSDQRSDKQYEERERGRANGIDSQLQRIVQLLPTEQAKSSLADQKTLAKKTESVSADKKPVEKKSTYVAIN